MVDSDQIPDKNEQCNLSSFAFTSNSWLIQTGSQTLAQKFIENFKQAEPTSLDRITEAIVYASAKGCDKKIWENDDITELSNAYQKLEEENRKARFWFHRILFFV